tara:strand:- start:338 stop:1120 length:783 start_codon:yes stop_codon:yes gene_type:complete
MFNNNDKVFEMFNKSCLDSEMEYDKVFIDADSIIYRIAVTTDSVTQAKSAFDKALGGIMRDTGGVKGYVAVKGKGNFRYDIAEDYKAQRASTKIDPKITERRNAITEYAWANDCFKSDNCEADDICCIWAQEAMDAGDHYLIAHIDKDLNGCPGWHYNFNKKEFYFMGEEEAHKFFCLQLLTGDSTDHIMGLKGIGPKKAEKLLEGVPHEQLLDTVRNAWRDHHPRDWHPKLETCFNLIYMRRKWGDFRQLTLEEVFPNE